MNFFDKDETTAKLIKVEFYLTSFDGSEWNKEEMESALENSFEGIVFVSEYKDKDINWYDEIPLNQLDSTKEDFEEEFCK